tara:strand:+ start:2052 stop:2459 length:408 start_codon:yes stop_codon:yes gene_type:complete
MKKNLLIKLSIFIAIIVSQMLPLLQPVSTVQAAECCNINCGIMIDKMACPSLEKSQFCKSHSIECCKVECLSSSKDKIILNKSVPLKRLSQTLSVIKVSLINEPQHFNQSVTFSPCQKNKIQNSPLFQTNSVYLI